MLEHGRWQRPFFRHGEYFQYLHVYSGQNKLLENSPMEKQTLFMNFSMAALLIKVHKVYTGMMSLFLLSILMNAMLIAYFDELCHFFFFLITAHTHTKIQFNNNHFHTDDYYLISTWDSSTSEESRRIYRFYLIKINSQWLQSLYTHILFASYIANNYEI